MNPALVAGILLVAVALASSSAAEAEKWWVNEKGIAGGVLIKGSTSPDGKYALYEFNHEEGGAPTTATGIGLAPVDRSKLLFVIDARTKWMTDKEVPSFLTVAWSPNSTLIATHDSGSKHSKANIYRLHDGTASSLDMPDLLAAACTKLRVPQSSVTASGQIPKRWLTPASLEVTIHLTTAARKLTTSIAVRVADDGTVSIQ